MHMKSLSLASLIAIASMHATAASNTEAVLRDLSLCNSKFFSTLAEYKDTLSTDPNFRIKSNLGSFEVLDRGDTKLSARMFSAPIRIGEFEAVGYFDEYWEPQPKTFMISWGFLLRAPVKVVTSRSRALIWESQRLEAAEASFVRSEVWTNSKPEAGWQRIKTADGQLPPAGTVERVLMLEPYEFDPALTRFGCSLQGSVSREMLRSERPDLEQ